MCKWRNCGCVGAGAATAPAALALEPAPGSFRQFWKSPRLDFELSNFETQMWTLVSGFVRKVSRAQTALSRLGREHESFPNSGDLRIPGDTF